MISRVIATLLLIWLGSVLHAQGQQTEAEREAFARIKANADKGDAEAQLQLGLLYASGAGVARDVVKAAKWQRKAAEQGLPRAQYQMGLDYANGEGVKISQTEAANWFRKAAEQGMVEAQYEIGLCCLSGRGVRESGTEAVDWFRKAAVKGFVPSEYQLGNCYLQGTGVPKDIEGGIKRIRGAAESGLAAAQNKLGTCYQKGLGVPKDEVQAYKWFALSAAQDDEHALDIKVSLATLESRLTKEQIAEAQRLARDFKPGESSDQGSALSSGGAALSPDNNTRQTNPASSTEGAKTGYVTVKADDDHCEVFVDGAFVGNSPAKLKLVEGLHVIEVKKSGFKDYRRELKVMPGSDLTLTAGLERQ